MLKKVLVLLANGFEEMEAFTVVDILRRAGISVMLAGLDKGSVTGRSSIKVIPDIDLDSVIESSIDEIDMVVLPGGAVGADNLKADKRVRKIIDNLHKKQKYISAICAAPSVLSAVGGVLDGKKVTAYPSFSDEFKNYSEDRVVVDGNIITSKGPATSLEFAITLLELLCTKDKADEIKKQIIF